MEPFEKLPTDIVLKIIDLLSIKDLCSIVKSFQKFNELYCYYIYNKDSNKGSSMFNPLMFSNKVSIHDKLDKLDDIDQFINIPLFAQVSILIVEIGVDNYIDLSKYNEILKLKTQKRILVDLIDSKAIQTAPKNAASDKFLNISKYTFNVFTKFDDNLILLGIQFAFSSKNPELTVNNFYFTTSNKNERFNYDIQKSGGLNKRVLINATLYKIWKKGLAIDCESLKMNINSFEQGFKIKDLINFDMSQFKNFKLIFNEFERPRPPNYTGPVFNPRFSGRITRIFPSLSIVQLFNESLINLELFINVESLNFVIDELHFPNLKTFRLSFSTKKRVDLKLGSIKATNLETFEIELNNINDFNDIKVVKDIKYEYDETIDDTRVIYEKTKEIEFGKNLKKLIIKLNDQGNNFDLEKNSWIQTKLIELMGISETLQVYGSFPILFEENSKHFLKSKKLEFIDWIYDKNESEFEPNDELPLSTVESFKLNFTSIEKEFDELNELPVEIERIFPFNLDSLKTISIIGPSNQDKPLLLKLNKPIKYLENLELFNIKLFNSESSELKSLLPNLKEFKNESNDGLYKFDSISIKED